MTRHNRFARLFFASSAAVLLVAASRLPVSARAQDASADDKSVAAPADDQQSDIDALLKRCPGRVMPVCGTATSGGITLNYYFP